ncbi:hypothetical protein A2U01_0062260, partial [Trifolium medium]|nr:hypothetical protein [Trifolium medium]
PSSSNPSVPSIPSNSQQRNTSKSTTPHVSAPSPSSSNPSVPSLTPTHIEFETAPIEDDNDHNSQLEHLIPFGDPTLPGPHNPHLPWGKDHSDNKVWNYTLKG